MNDYEDLIIAVYSGGTELLSEQTRISGSPAVLQRSEYFSKLLHIEKGEEPTKDQLEIYATQREYIVPVMNRGQIITDCIWGAATESCLDGCNNWTLYPSIFSTKCGQCMDSGICDLFIRVNCSSARCVRY